MELIGEYIIGLNADINGEGNESLASIDGNPEFNIGKATKTYIYSYMAFQNDLCVVSSLLHSSNST